MVATEIEFDINDLDYDLPSTWKGRMEAIIAGAVDYDDIEPLAMMCAAIADKATDVAKVERDAKLKAEGKIDISPSWSVVMEDLYIEKLLALRGGKLTKKQRVFTAEVVRCGEIADAFLAGSIV